MKVNGQQELLEVKIASDVVDPSDIQMLEDLVMFAIQDAMKRSREYAEERLGGLYKGLNLPNIPGIKFPKM